MKQCTKCRLEKNLSEYHKDGGALDGHRGMCKTCRSENVDKKYVSAKNKEHRLKHKTKECIVYYLPEEHYVGITNNLRFRMKAHRQKGKITEGYEVIAKFERSVDAHLLETMFHMRNYNGFKK